MTPDEGDELRNLQERMARASDAAERLLAEAVQSVIGDAARSDRPPPSGWQMPSTDGEEATAEGEFEVVVQILGRLRELIPPELRRRLQEALRELLLAVRALIDWYLERVERRRAAPAEVEDIPIL